LTRPIPALLAAIVLSAAGCAPAPAPDLWFVADPAQVTRVADPAGELRIATWTDRVGEVEAVSGATPDARPVLVEDPADGGPAVRFGGFVGLRIGPTDVLTADGLCALVVGRLAEPADRDAWFLSAVQYDGLGWPPPDARLWSLHSGPDGRLRAEARAAAPGATPALSESERGGLAGRRELLTVCWSDDGRIVLRRDGVASEAAGGVAPRPDGPASLYLGTSGAHGYLRGDLAEVRVYARPLSPRQLRAAERELAASHRIPLPHADTIAIYVVVGGWGLSILIGALVWRVRRRRS